MTETGGITLIKQAGQQDDSYCQARVNQFHPADHVREDPIQTIIKHFERSKLFHLENSATRPSARPSARPFFCGAHP